MRSSPDFRPMPAIGRVPLLKRGFYEAIRDGWTAVDVANLQSVVRIKGLLDVPALAASFDSLVQRHDVLRARVIETNGLPFVSYEEDTCPRLESLSATSEDEARDLVTARVQRRFSTATEPLVRLVLVRISEQDHVLALIVSHLVSDAQSLGILSDELCALYRIQTGTQDQALPPVGLQYRDYSQVMQEWQQLPAAQVATDYWKQVLTQAAPTELRTDLSSQQTTASGAGVPFHLDTALIERLGLAARQNRVTPATLLLAADMLAIHRHSGLEDITINVLHTGRETTELQRTVGLLADIVIHRERVTDDLSPKELVARVHRATVSGARYRFLRSDILRPTMKEAGTNVFGPDFNMRPPMGATLASSFTESVSPFPIGPYPHGTVARNHCLILQPTLQGVWGMVLYSAAKYTQQTIQRFVDLFQGAVAEMA